MKSSTNQRKMSFKEFFIGMTIAAIVMGGLCLAIRLSGGGNADFQVMNPVLAFLIGFAPIELFALVIYAAVRTAGHDSIPIK